MEPKHKHIKVGVISSVKPSQPIKRKDILKHLSQNGHPIELRTLRRMREEINQECEYWQVIIGYRHKKSEEAKKKGGDDRGYYLCDTHAKMVEYCRNMYAQAKNMREQADMAKDMYNRLNSKQIKFDFADV